MSLKESAISINNWYIDNSKNYETYIIYRNFFDKKDKKIQIVGWTEYENKIYVNCYDENYDKKCYKLNVDKMLKSNRKTYYDVVDILFDSKIYYFDI
jgi:hypothetical protein